MATLHENTQKFNAKMTVTNTGGNLSADAIPAKQVYQDKLFHILRQIQSLSW